ncbi:hypothetical protein INQ45_11940 [Flavobacterium columnare]|uniref:hypothetical protein n=1 Tax=Flavobacterium columnare TaxID=996 RepID=UPI002D2163BB|nr:hypothetical protein [Flavobacterium columnare]MEB3801739.1 hypothetical protein [Flavobacterium columnare]
MSTSILTIICSLALFLFLLFEVYVFFSQIIPILVDKSFGDKSEINSKLNNKKAVMKTYFFVFFVISFMIAIYMIKSSDNLVLISLGFVVGCVLMFLFHYFPKKVENNNYFRNIENAIPFVKVLNELKPSSLQADEIKNQFDYALKQNYFVCEFSQFEDLLKLNNPEGKIIWKPISHTKFKDRQLLLTFLNVLFQKQLIKIDRKEVCQFINKYFEFNESGHHKKENPLVPDNVGKWISNPKGVL